MIAFRESFQTPLKKVVMGLRPMVCSEMGLERVGQNVPVAQRLKRSEQSDPQFDKAFDAARTAAVPYLRRS